MTYIGSFGIINNNMEKTNTLQSESCESPYEAELLGSKELFNTLTSEEFLADRKSWIDQRRSELQTQLTAQNNDYQLIRKLEREELALNSAEWNLEWGRVVSWGEESGRLLGELCGLECRSNDMPVDRGAVRYSEEEVRRRLADQPFVPMKNLVEISSHRAVELKIPDDSVVFVPVENIVSADGFSDSWIGEGGKSYTDRNGVHRNGTSMGAIMDYAVERDTPLPPVEYICGFMQPDGKIAYAVNGGNHRVAAAITRGDSSLAISRSIALRSINENILDTISR